MHHNPAISLPYRPNNRIQTNHQMNRARAYPQGRRTEHGRKRGDPSLSANQPIRRRRSDHQYRIGASIGNSICDAWRDVTTDGWWWSGYRLKSRGILGDFGRMKGGGSLVMGGGRVVLMRSYGLWF